MRAATKTLSPFKITIGSRGAVLPCAEFVRVHGQAHGTPRLAPLHPGVDEYPVQPLGLGVATDRLRSRNHQHTDAWTDLASAQDIGGRAVSDRVQSTLHFDTASKVSGSGAAPVVVVSSALSLVVVNTRPAPGFTCRKPRCVSRLIAVDC